MQVFSECAWQGVADSSVTAVVFGLWSSHMEGLKTQKKTPKVE